ncbi:MAG: hypothetical protein CL624_09245 [Arcobacter sp.]|nr:hypothetical protein [Arcobacter sp.]|tara:strand:- start:6044 stop:6967 length:924 start_codon:yes stop_codon:yes gene_type:complete
MKNKIKALLVEDSKINQIVAKKSLEKYSFDVDLAENGVVAIEMYEKSQYDIIFMDLQMPIMDGFEASKHIRKTNKNIPIISLSASEIPRKDELSLESGINENISKPIENKILEDIISKYLKISIEGIDLEELRVSLELDENEISSMLNKFANTYDNFRKNIQSLEIDSKEFDFLLHKLKGVTASLRINEVYKVIVGIAETNDKSLKKQKILELILKLEETISLIRDSIYTNEVQKLSNKEVLKSLDDLLLDIENYAFIKQDRITLLIKSLEDIVSKEILDDLLSNFTKNNLEKLKENIIYLKGCINE